MLFRILFSVGFLLINCFVSYGQTSDNWVWKASSFDGDDFYQMTTFKAKEYSDGPSILVWEKVKYKDKTKIIKGKKVINKGGYQVNLVEYFCSDGKYRTVQSATYYSSGTLKSSFENEYGEQIYPTPGTVGEEMYKSACNLIKD